MKQGEILLLGDINIDTAWPVSEFPIPGRDGLVDDVTMEIGGAVVNSAILLDRLGQQTSLLGCVGKDIWAERIMEKLSQTNINLSSVQTDPDAMTGLNFTIVTPDGERTMFTQRGANIHQKPQDMNEDAFTHASMLHISGYALLEAPQRDSVWRAVELAKKHKVPISLDTGLEPVIKNPEDFRKLLSELTVCISGPEEISVLLGSSSPEEAANRLISSGIQLAAIKLGGKGSIVANQREQIFCPAFPVKAIDSTGAGDSYSAGLLYGWVNNLSLSAYAVLASALGALAATTYGAGFSLPDKRALIGFLQTTQIPSVPSVQNGIKELVNYFGKPG